MAAIKFYFLMAASYFFAEYKKKSFGRVALSYWSCAMACVIKNIYTYIYENKPRKSNQSLKPFSNMSRKAKSATVGIQKGMSEKSNFSGFVLVRQLCAEVTHIMETY